MNETTSPSYIYIEEIQGFKKTLRPKNSNVGFALEMLLVRCGGLLDHCWLLYTLPSGPAQNYSLGSELEQGVP